MGSLTTASTQVAIAPLTRSATFLALSVTNPSVIPAIRSTLASVSSLVKNVAFRDSDANLSCTIGIGSSIWDELTNLPRPKELHPFREVKGAKHTAISTPETSSSTYALSAATSASNLSASSWTDSVTPCSSSTPQLGSATSTPATSSALSTAQRTLWARMFRPLSSSRVSTTQTRRGGSYVVVQKYVHDMAGWKSLSTEQQERIIGRTKPDNIELDDVEDGRQASHKTLSTIEDEDGHERDILRDNMPFGSPASGEFGTYFIGYTRRLWVIEKMLERMFVGNPPGLHDRLLDFSRPMTGSVFFAPSATVLAGLDG
ncbi:hypothetical protein N7530_006260 [Penicillium desertorum]|uniref:Dyp-type peroxidase n=1 Tax=Penicillium desertorum TaxID=1303715 RepID=A0A9W9WRG9_9EURO|nr:hypothetical protein N7530_006260 [Penicillium desertorum]